MNSVAWASFYFLSQPFFSMHRLLSCSGKSCALFKLNFARWLVLELFICPKDRGRVGQITAVLPDSLLHACLPFLTAVSCLLWCFNIISVSLWFSPSSHSACSPLQWQVTLMNIFYLTKSNQRCIIICFVATVAREWIILLSMDKKNVKDNDNTVLRWKLESKKSALWTHKLAKTHW